MMVIDPVTSSVRTTGTPNPLPPETWIPSGRAGYWSTPPKKVSLSD